VPCKLIIGGGDLLRTDRNLIAQHYGGRSRRSYGMLRRSLGTRRLPGYFLQRVVPRLDADSYHAKRFIARWMDYPAGGPFLINPDDLPPGSTVVYLSCGVPHNFLPAESEQVKRTLDRASFIYLRDEQSAEKLRRAGVSRQITVAPDIAVTLSDHFEHAEQAQRGRAILSGFGIDAGRPVLCFQSKPYTDFSVDEILRQLKRYQERTQSEIVLLPTGYCHGDHELLQRLGKQSGGTLKYAGVHSVFDMISIIAASNLFIGTSLHGNITAFSYGIPHLFGPLPVDKAEGFLKITGLPAELKLDSWSEISDKINMISKLPPAFFSQRARSAKAEAYRAVNNLLNALRQ